MITPWPRVRRRTVEISAGPFQSWTRSPSVTPMLAARVIRSSRAK